MSDIAIVGSSGHARVIVDLVEQEGRHRIVGFIDPVCPVGTMVSGYPVLGTAQDLRALAQKYGLAGYLVAIGHNHRRARVVGEVALSCPELPLVSAIHPCAVLAKGCCVEAGAVVMAGAVIGVNSRVGRGCIVNTRASLDHDCVMGDFSSLAPGTTTGGGVHIGEGAAIGIGATILHMRKVGRHSVVGAGAVVLHDVADGVVAYGAPARTVRERHPQDQYL